MIGKLIDTELRQLDRMRDALPLLFDHEGRPLGLDDLLQRYDERCRRLERLAADGSLAPAELDELRDALDWFEALHRSRASLLAGSGPVVF